MNVAWASYFISPRRLNQSLVRTVRSEGRQVTSASQTRSPQKRASQKRAPQKKAPTHKTPKQRRSRTQSPWKTDSVLKRPRATNVMKVAVIGCTHGEIDALYTAVAEVERAQSAPIDLIVCAGDFQAVRNAHDLRCMNCPDKYRDMRSFWKYYSGKRQARIPTLFVGGNHEASNHLQEMPLGGLVAPNMYYLGNAGVVNFRGVRIAGVSGVYVEHSYNKARVERPPYQRSQIRTVYHARNEDVERLLRLKRPVDICLSHDWPRGITDFGDVEKLLRVKKHLRAEIMRGSLGNPGTMQVLRKMQPTYWFAAHMHVKFPALVTHEDTGMNTKFLSLDKILPGREFLQVIDLAVPEDMGTDGGLMDATSDEQVLQVDAEWLSILRTEANEPGRSDSVTDAEMADTVSFLAGKGVRTDVRLESDFERRAPVYNRNNRTGTPQTFCMQPRNVELIDALTASAPPEYALFHRTDEGDHVGGAEAGSRDASNG